MPPARKIRCALAQITIHGEGVYSLALEPEKDLPAFRPGQFLHLAVDPYDPSGFWPESRAFSIASSPECRRQLRLTYSVRGQFTARMERELKVGSEVWVKLPYGEFSVEAQGHPVLIAGGTGITPFCSFLENLSYPHVTLFYGARHPDLLIYQGLVEAVQQRLPGFQAYTFVEQAAPAGSAVIRGRLSIEEIWPRLDEPLAATYYLSGPPAMLRGLSQALASRGVPPNAIRMDAWE